MCPVCVSLCVHVVGELMFVLSEFGLASLCVMSVL